MKAAWGQAGLRHAQLTTGWGTAWAGCSAAHGGSMGGGSLRGASKGYSAAWGQLGVSTAWGALPRGSASDSSIAATSYSIAATGSFIAAIINSPCAALVPADLSFQPWPLCLTPVLPHPPPITTGGGCDWHLDAERPDRAAAAAGGSHHDQGERGLVGRTSVEG